MDRFGNWMLGSAVALYSLFFINVAIGAFGGSSYLSDITEMLVLFAACILFVVSLLIKERAEKSDPN